MFRFIQHGDWTKTTNFLKKAERIFKEAAFDKYGKVGVSALESATPKETGATANAWTYEIERGGNQVSIIWKNSNEPNGFPVAVMLQFGHGTGTGVMYEELTTSILQCDQYLRKLLMICGGRLPTNA